MAAKAPDRRVQRTQQLLQTALISLIQEKGYEALSVHPEEAGRWGLFVHIRDAAQARRLVARAIKDGLHIINQLLDALRAGEDLLPWNWKL